MASLEEVISAKLDALGAPQAPTPAPGPAPGAGVDGAGDYRPVFRLIPGGVPDGDCAEKRFPPPPLDAPGYARLSIVRAKLRCMVRVGGPRPYARLVMAAAHARARRRFPGGRIASLGVVAGLTEWMAPRGL